jgi:hypothetical protein
MIDITNLYGYIGKMSTNLSFIPVPRQRERHDGWTVQKQGEFIEALSLCGIVLRAADTVGMNAASAYKLREAEGAESFAAAWDAAVRMGSAQLADIAMDRAINGVAIPHYYKGQMVGEHRWYDNKLLMFMLRHTHTQKFGRFAEEVQMVEQIAREEAAVEAKRLEQLANAEALLAQTQAELEELEADISVEQGLEARTLRHTLAQRRDRLQSIVAQLRQVDSLHAAEASIEQCVAEGRYSARHGAIFKKQLRGPGP